MAEEVTGADPSPNSSSGGGAGLVGPSGNDSDDDRISSLPAQGNLADVRNICPGGRPVIEGVQSANVARCGQAAASATLPEWARMQGDGQARRPGGGPAPRRGVRAEAKRPLGYGSISSRGAVVRSPWLPVVGQPPTVHNRGTVNGFSAKSARRLREFLVLNEGRTGGEPWGITATVPGPVPAEGEFRQMFHAWCCRVNRLGAPICWRIELQQRGSPHVHGVGWGKSVGVWLAWHEVLAATGPVQGLDGKGRAVSAENRGMWPGALSYAARVDHLESGDPSGWFRYLVGHASKSKAVQLGWQGRQWGVLNRSQWRASKLSTWELNQGEVWRVNRTLRKLTGLRRVSHHGKTVWLVKPATVRRVIEWARAF